MVGTRLKMGIYTFLHWIVYCLWLLGFVQNGNCAISYAPVVKLPLGRAVGIQVDTPDGAYHAYRGIPYAEKPIGSRRFEPPEPYSKKWYGDRKFTEYRNNCIGLDNEDWYGDFPIGPNNKKYIVSGSEDCLYLNVHRSLKLKKTTPVIFFIHGGFFSYSDRERYGPDYLMQDNVVFVNFAYRVGPFGFLSTGSDVCSGNMGLKDIVKALNWVKINIWIFGGNTDKITLAGIDAGAASAHFIYYSRASNELFNNAISYSGTAFSPWAFSKMSTVVERTRALAAQLNCDTIAAGDLLRCLRSRGAREIVESLANSKSFYYIPFARFTPVDDSTFQHGFFLDNPATMAKEKRSKLNNWITGYTAQNGLYPIAEFANRSDALKLVHDRWDDILPDLLFFNKNCKNLITYAKLSGFSRDFGDLLELVTDRYYSTPAFFSASRMSERSDGETYMYLYDHRTEFSRAAALTNLQWNEHPFYGSASHGDDIANVFSIRFYGLGQHDRDWKVRKSLINILLTYGLTGQPPSTLNWNQVNKEKPTVYLEVSPNVTERNIAVERSYKISKFDILFADPKCQI